MYKWFSENYGCDKCDYSILKIIGNREAICLNCFHINADIEDDPDWFYSIESNNLETLKALYL
jgi:hypothetical protein